MKRAGFALVALVILIDSDVRSTAGDAPVALKWLAFELGPPQRQRPRVEAPADHEFAVA